MSMKTKHRHESTHLRRDGYWAGHPCYLVEHHSLGVMGRVFRRNGGWWGWQSNINGVIGGQWCKTRREAVRAVVSAFSRSAAKTEKPA